jgi:hypothetical protein
VTITLDIHHSTTIYVSLLGLLTLDDEGTTFFENWRSDYPVMQSTTPEERDPKKVTFPPFYSEVTNEPLMAQNVQFLVKLSNYISLNRLTQHK